MSKIKIILTIVVIVILIGGGTYIVSNDSKVVQEPPITSISKETLNQEGASTTVSQPSEATKPVVKPAVTGSVETPAIKTTGSGSVSVTITKSFSTSDVAQHSSSQSCWSIVNGKVYDLTSWIGKHPGGSGAIKSMCGVDASDEFNDEHGGQRRPANELAGFYIGDLK